MKMIVFSLLATVLVFSFRVKASAFSQTLCPHANLLEGMVPPRFNQSVYKKSVKEDIKTITILFVKATDTAKVRYKLVPGKDEESNRLDTFGVGSITGAVGVNNQLDYDRLPRNYKFAVKAFGDNENVFDCAIIEINLLDVNDNKPKISSASKQDYRMPENTHTFSIKLNGTDADAGGEKNNQIRYYIGNEYKAMFELNEVTGRLKLKPGHEFDREDKDIIDITVTLKDQNGLTIDGVEPQTNNDLTISIRVGDENDNAPIFGRSGFYGKVDEDKDVGYKIVKIFALDKDIDSAIEFTIDSGNDDGLFGISADNYTVYQLKPGVYNSPHGRNTSAWIVVKKPLDFEKKDSHELKIKAKDGVNSAATATVSIQVMDANDEIPVFAKPIYPVDIQENSVKGLKVLQVSATDKDKVSIHLTYSLEDKAKGKLEIDNNTGIVTTGSLGFDYEKEPEASFIVYAFDGKNKGTAVIKCKIIDMNDNPPYFIGDPYEFSVKENMKPGAYVGTIKAKDRDVGKDSKITFNLVTNGDERFSIHPDTGKITTIRKLDREKKHVHQIVVEARDSGNPPYSNTTTVIIKVTDVNDNGPLFNQTSYCGKVIEEDASKQIVVAISVSDPDTEAYSCPCDFSIVNGSLNGVFKLYKHPDTLTAYVYKKAGVKFDFEKIQKYRIWISATDSGNPAMKSFTYVDVDVIDINDNSPKSGGKLELLINSYKGQFKGGVIGRPYIIDDDRGDSDKYNFQITKQVVYKQNTRVQYFSAKNDDASSRGGIVAVQGIPSGQYDLTVESTETNGPSSNPTAVTSNVIVTVRTVSEKDVDNSVALRMTGLNHETSCGGIKLPDFAKILSEILKVPEENVIVFSAQKVPGLHLGVDVRFAVKKKIGFSGPDPVYMKPIELIPLLSEAIKKIEEKTGGKVKNVGIDQCATEICKNPTGFCFNKVIASKNYTVVTDDNGIVPANVKSESFLSIDTRVDALCREGPIKPTSCPACLNGGKCENNTNGGYTCRCPKGFDGPECQATTISFKSTEAYIWLKPLNYFVDGVITLDFLTKERNGLILYQGPISDLRSDFIALEIVGGKIMLTMTQGDSYLFKRTLTNGKKLNDGVYHHIKIHKKGKVVTLTVDGCDDAVVTETPGGVSKQSRDKCEITGNTTGDYSMINGLNPLQLGGIKPKTIAWPALTSISFVKGCIRRLVDNGVMYDFAHPIEKHPDAVLGCPGLGCIPDCVNGHCVMTRSPFKCSCLPGYIGDTCTRRVKSYHYTANSYSEYAVVKPVSAKADSTTTARNWYEKYKTNYLVQIRTKTNGTIVYESTDLKALHQEYSILEIANNQLRYRVNLGDKETKIEFPKSQVDVTDGYWRNVTVARVGNHVHVTVEEGGKVSAYREENLGTHRLLDTNGKIFTGGLPDEYKYPSNDMQGCLGDNRFGGVNLDESPNVKIVKRVNVEVRCPCQFLVCLNGGYCMAGSPPYCICPAGYSGPRCESTPVSQPLMGGQMASMGTAAYIIIACILFIFILALIFISLLVAGKFRKKKVYITLDDDMKDNIMPYNDEGAGDDDFHNYDLEKLLSHANRIPRTPVQEAPLKKAPAKPMHEAMVREDIEAPLLVDPLQDKPAPKFAGDPADTVDVARFITTRVGDADTEDAAYPHDTMLHYGYEGEGSDVEDLSEIDSDGEESDDEADFGFLSDWGAKFDNLDKIFNPEEEDDEDV